MKCNVCGQEIKLKPSQWNNLYGTHHPSECITALKSSLDAMTSELDEWKQKALAFEKAHFEYAVELLHLRTENEKLKKVRGVCQEMFNFLTVYRGSMVTANLLTHESVGFNGVLVTMIYKIEQALRATEPEKCHHHRITPACPICKTEQENK